MLVLGKKKNDDKYTPYVPKDVKDKIFTSPQTLNDQNAYEVQNLPK